MAGLMSAEILHAV